MDLHTLGEIRLQELAQATSLFPAKARVLELGAGTGFQAAHIESMGYSVTALDIPPYDEATSEYAASQVFPVKIYDGSKIPYSDGSFDVVFSSYLLEHVRDPVSLLKECARVLAPGGRTVMLVPTPAWRFWSMVAYYPARLVSGIRRLAGSLDDSEDSASEPWRLDSLSERIRWAIIPRRHGETGTAATELVTYSRWWWRKAMRGAGLRVVDERALGVFSTGEFLSSLSIRQRVLLARIAGSAGRAYVATKQ